MKKVIYFLIFLCIINSVFSYSPISNSENNIGNDQVENHLVTQQQEITDNVLDIQLSNGKDSTQKTLREQEHELQKTLLITQANESWKMNLGLLVLVKEIFVILLYVLEMRLILYFFFELMPKVFFALRDSMIKFFMLRWRRD